MGTSPCMGLSIRRLDFLGTPITEELASLAARIQQGQSTRSRLAFISSFTPRSKAQNRIDTTKFYLIALVALCSETNFWQV